MMFDELNNILGPLSADQRLSRFDTFYSVVAFIINSAIVVTAGAATITLAWSMIQFITARGDPKDMEAAWHSFQWSLIAIGVALMAIAIKTAILNAFGVPNAADENPYY